MAEKITSGRFKFRYHPEHIEQKTPYRVCRIIRTPTQAQRTPLAVSSSAIFLASGRRRASRSSFVTTRLSPARTAAIASRKPGRARFVPGKPLLTVMAGLGQMELEIKRERINDSPNSICS